MKQNNSLLSTMDLCDRLGVTRQAVYKWRQSGMPVEIKHKKTIRYSWKNVKSWLNRYRGR